jgi:hypothetical protein
LSYEGGKEIIRKRKSFRKRLTNSVEFCKFGKKNIRVHDEARNRMLICEIARDA